MKIVAFYILFVFFIVALYGFAFSMNLAEQPDGKKVFADNKCSTCHTLEAEGIVRKGNPPKNAPADLSLTGSKFTPEKFANYITKKESLNNKKHPASFKGTDDDLKALSKWLLGIKKTALSKNKKVTQ